MTVVTAYSRLIGVASLTVIDRKELNVQSKSDKPKNPLPFQIGDHVVIPAYTRKDLRFGVITDVEWEPGKSDVVRRYRIRRPHDVTFVAPNLVELYVPEITIFVHNGTVKMVRSNMSDLGVCVVHLHDNDALKGGEDLVELQQRLREIADKHPYLFNKGKFS